MCNVLLCRKKNIVPHISQDGKVGTFFLPLSPSTVDVTLATIYNVGNKVSCQATRVFVIEFSAMSILKDPIDYKGLELELHEAMRADELYRLQNDAKLRAIEQAVPTYKDFREMVNGAHLKSLDRKDMVPKIGVKWNSIASDKSLHCNENLKINQRKAKQISSNAIPRNAHEFRQTWKSIDNYREKFELLKISRYCRPQKRLST